VVTDPKARSSFLTAFGGGNRITFLKLYRYLTVTVPKKATGLIPIFAVVCVLQPIGRGGKSQLGQ
jgi:hypothetical protein